MHGDREERDPHAGLRERGKCQAYAHQGDRYGSDEQEPSSCGDGEIPAGERGVAEG